MYFDTDFGTLTPPKAPRTVGGHSDRTRVLTEPPRLYGVAALGKPRHPSFRVVEVTRDASGRTRKQGQIWQPDLDSARRFARALAANSSSDRVLVADAAGELLEQLPVIAPEARDGSVTWGNWRSLPLPPLPPRPPRPAPKAPQVRHIDLPVLDEYGGTVDLALPEDV